METATDKVPNTSATAASASSDLNGMAIMVCKNIFFYSSVSSYLVLYIYIYKFLYCSNCFIFLLFFYY